MDVGIEKKKIEKTHKLTKKCKLGTTYNIINSTQQYKHCTNMEKSKAKTNIKIQTTLQRKGQ